MSTALRSNTKKLEIDSRNLTIDRLFKTWKIEYYMLNGHDHTALDSGYSETFFISGVYSYFWGSMEGRGEWSLQNLNREISLRGNDGQSSRTLVILKLEEKSFWYYYFDGTYKHEIHLVAA